MKIPWSQKKVLKRVKMWSESFTADRNVMKYADMEDTKEKRKGNKNRENKGRMGRKDRKNRRDMGWRAERIKRIRRIREIKQAGLKFKIPFIQKVVVYDNRLLNLEPPAQEVVLNDKKRLDVDNFTRYRIVAPLKFYQTVRNEYQARSKLEEINKEKSDFRKEESAQNSAQRIQESREKTNDAMWRM